MKTRPSARITVEGLMDRARKAAGLTDFGDPWFTAPLGCLVEFINQEAALPSAEAPPVLGLIGNLADRLRLVDYLKRHPAVRDERLDVAGVIIGLPRGGSTLLQRLLSTSPQLTSTYWWEMMFPVPYPDEAPGEPVERISDGRRAAEAMRAAWPELQIIHPLDPMSYDEEIILIDRSFMSLMYSFYFDIPSYAHWQTKQDHRKAYEELKLWLQLLQYSAPERRSRKWLLKSPHHLLSGALQTMMNAFPDAKVLMTHRAMENVVPSFCSNQSVTMRGSAGRFDARRLGPQAIRMFSEALRNLLAVREKMPDGRFIDIRYTDMMSDPLGGYRKTIEQMGLQVGPADESAATSWMSQNSRDTHPRHGYKATDYGTTEVEIAKALGFYADRFVS